jgi:hypothetical protein
MNRIIRGRRYNTEKAKRIGSVIQNDGLLSATLYRNRGGAYFYHLTDETGGGVLVPAALGVGHAFTFGNYTPEGFMEAFCQPTTGERSVLFAEVGADIMAGLRAGASAENMTVKAFVERIVREALENPNQK